jgi:predicted DNA-binding transcriptional regulator YafY
MRADRLLSLLLLLQTHGRMTARRLAAELEVSERTIYRDIQALSTAGVPVYGLGGVEGGYELVESYRTDLTGLTEGEARALFMLSIPDALTKIGVGQELKAALLKLSAALPAARRQDEARVRQRFYLDPSGDGSAGAPPSHLSGLYQAVWKDRCIRIAYRAGPVMRVEHVVEPYALVVERGEWRLVSNRNGRLRVQRVADLLDVQLTDETFIRPADFDLEAFWRGWRLEREQQRRLYAVTVRVAPDFLPWLPHFLGEAMTGRVDTYEAAADDGWITLQLLFGSLEAARERLLGCGGAVEVIEPFALRCSLADVAQQIVRLYDRSPRERVEEQS